MLDLSRSVRGLLNQAVDQAKLAQQQQRWANAAESWDEAARLAIVIAESSRSNSEKTARQRAASEFRQLAQQIRERMAAGTEARLDSISPVDDRDELSAAIQSFRHRSTIGWNQVAGLDETVRAIQSAYALSVARLPQGIELRGKHNLLFYGPPGCGKSLLAAAASNGLDAAFFNVPVSGLVSKWFGESSKLVSALYREARRFPISIVFLDEIDALATTRDSQDSNASRQILANLLSELDGVASKDHPNIVITIAATNTPWDLDSAILSRFSRRVLIPLPDDAARAKLFQLQLLDRGFQLETSLDDLGVLTKGFSGREIEQICQALIERMIWRENPNLTALSARGQAALADYTVTAAPIRATDVEAVLRQFTPQTTRETQQKFERWGK
ncbi:MAG: ATP-binding protein [Planctomycetaceae bacterium]|nr:ATP-binding protein [Planctomycetaceae bacterium]